MTGIRIQRVVLLLALSAVLCAGCALQNTAGNAGQEPAETASGSVASGIAYEAELGVEPIHVSDVTSPAAVQEKYGLALPQLEQILEEFEFQAYWSYWMKGKGDYLDEGMVLEAAEIFDRPLDVSVYYQEGGSDYAQDSRFYRIMCPVETKEKDFWFVTMIYGPNGFLSYFRGEDAEYIEPEDDVRTPKGKKHYTYLGTGTVSLEKEKAEAFVYQPGNTPYRKLELEKIKTAVESNFSRKGKYKIYIKEFLEGDHVVEGCIVAPDNSHTDVPTENQGNYTKNTLFLDSIFQDAVKLKELEGFYVFRFDEREEGSYEEMTELADEEKPSGRMALIWEFEK
ncbi:MAG: hypothetical protein J1F02_06530 [Lachnospiraceae bacterium]|nr:hypothetical protein [Lachnospiraceae bacterium]